VTRSIQRHLIVWLSAILATSLLVIAVSTYYFVHAQITQVFDEELVMMAEAVHLGEVWTGPARVRIPRPGFNLSVRAYNPQGVSYFETLEPALPDGVPRSFQTGHATFDTNTGEWRVYTHVTPEGIVQVAQPIAMRKELASKFSWRMAMPEMLLIPLFVLIIASVLRRGLVPIREISQRVRNRSAERLDPLSTKDVPIELLPLIEQINALLARLGMSMATQRRFVEDAAHELRTPVAALVLQAQVAERSTDPEARAAAFAELRKGTVRTARVVEQLLNLAQTGPEASAEQFRKLDLARVARDVVGQMALAADARGIDLGAEAPGPAPVFGSADELASLIGNLVDNALRYAPAGTEVTVNVAADDSQVSMRVIDAGPGIAPEEREAVFERFHRASGDSTPGIGLGLAIVKAIVERHHGSISMEQARPGENPPGLAVVLVLPRDRS